MTRVIRTLVVCMCVVVVASLLRASLPTVQTGSWVSAGNLSQARNGAASVLLPDGRILIIGGDVASQPSNSVEVFNTNGSYSQGAAMSSARSGHSAFLLATGDVLVTGGRTSGGGITNSAEIYDALQNKWTAAPTMVEARAGHTAVQLLDGSLLIVGGENSGGAVSAVEHYSLTDGTFTQAGVLNQARTDAAAAPLNDGRVLIAGGSVLGTDGNSSPVVSVEIFDPTTGVATAAAGLSVARAGASATALLDGRVAVIGGNDGSTDLASAEIYDPTSGNWSTVSGATARSHHIAVLLPNNNSVLVTGGSAGAASDLFMPWANSNAGSFVSTSASGASHKDGFALGMSVEGLLFAGAGDAGTGTELYRFATVKTDQSDYAPGTIVNISGSGWQPGETVTLTLVESPLVDTHPVVTAVADGNGNIVNTDFVPDVYDLNIRFYLTAKGSQSQAQTTFMDSVNSATLTSPTTASPVTLTSFPLTVTIAFNYSTSTTGTTTGVATVSTSPAISSPGTLLTSGLNKSASIPVTLPATTPNGAYNASVTVTNNSGTGSNQKSDNANSGVHVDVPITQLVFTTPAINTTTVPTTCLGPITVESRDSTGAARNPFSDLTVLLSTTSGGGTFYSNNSCNSSTASVVIASNKTSANFWYKDSVNGQPTITASGSYEGTPLLVTQVETIGTACTAPSISVPPASTSKTVGDSVTFAVTASGTAPLSYQWRKGGAPIGGATSSSYAIASVALTDAGSYDVVVTNSCGSATSTGATLAVNKKTQTITFDTLSNKAYGDADFNVSATATSGLTVSFIASGNCTVSGNTVHITAAGSCTITAQQAGDSTTWAAATDVPQSFNIGQADAVINVSGYTGVYDGNAHGATGSAKGVKLEDLSSLLHLGTSFTDVPGGTAHWTFDGNTNYKTASGDVAITISQADATITVNGYSNVYDGNAHWATGSAKGVKLEDLSSLLHLGSSFTNVPGGTAHWTFDGDINYKPASSDVSITISQADAVINVSGFTGIYDGNAHGATGSATGVKGENLGSLLHLGASFTNVAGGTANWTFDGNTNYKGASGSVSITINRATLTVTADNQTMTLHGAVPTLTFKITGFKNGETASVLTTQPTCTTTGTSSSGVGSYPITCSGGAAANYTFSYVPSAMTILYSTGACLGDLGHTVLQPINASSTMSVFKLGSTVPTKFRVCDANGVSIGTPGVVTGYGLLAVASTPTITVDEDAYSTTPDTAFRWTGDQWIFNQSTKNNGTLNHTGTTYSFGIHLDDGSWIYFQYGLK